MDREEILKVFKRKQLEESLEGDFLATKKERISRYQELDFIKLTPNTHFAFVSVECINLYRDGYFLACIALCQAVAEAIVRLMCVRSKFPSVSDDYEKNVENLQKRKIEPDCSDLFKEIWNGRNDYHHLNPEVPTEISKLQDIAKSKILTLHKIESKVFDFAWTEDGAISPKFPKFWDFNENGMLNVYLRFET
ncbi:MAG: hypothetical protein AAB116_08075 [Candidatus Poribacteria bacterium]